MIRILKIALGQISPKLGDVAANLAKHLDWIDRARAEGAQLIVFPELSLTGYYLMDLVHDVAIEARAGDPIFDQLLAASADIDVVFGFIERDARQRLFYASAYLSRGAVLHIHRKLYPVTYGMFDDGRFVGAGSVARAFDAPAARAGIMICEDGWHMSVPYLLWQDGADLLLWTNASPGRGLGEPGRLSAARVVENTACAYASLLTTPVVFVNRVGYEDGNNFWGGSMVFDADGDVVARAPDFEEALTYAELDLNETRRARARLPLLRDERRDLTLRELTRISAERPA
ncbi:MAG TPA: nitrilase-related carbon-nitrogen hydrolase [Thermoflexales bacterium]|nr:nitrilase-related carbon-nitrogen hydrolase [Thermoflexales bacterium]